MTTLVSETLCVMNIDLLRDSQIQLCQLLYIPCELSQLLEHLWAGMLSPDRRPQVLPQTLEVFAGIFMSVELSREWLLQPVPAPIQTLCASQRRSAGTWFATQTFHKLTTIVFDLFKL